MESWLKISLLLCSFGFFKELRPSEPFVTEYLSGPWRNITAEQVNQEIYPFGTYAVLAQLVIVFLITDILRYKPIIILMACAGIVLFALLLWTKTVWELQIAQVFYGTFAACEVAYYTYIYAKVEKDRYQIVTGHTRAATLSGRFLGGVLAQVFISLEIMDYRGLHFISFGTQIVSLFIALALPSVRRSLYFYAQKDIEDISSRQTQAENTSRATTEMVKAGDVEIYKTVADISFTNSSASTFDRAEPKFSWRNATKLLWQHTVSAYSNPHVVRWSCWWALATCGQLQVITYVQFLWKEINTESNESYYNGGVEAAVTLLGAVGAMTAGLMNSSRHRKWHMWILTICSLLMGAFLIISSITHLIWVAYAMYVFFGIVYFFVITIASATVAENLIDDSFALIFGINNLVALSLQTILTLIVLTIYGLSARRQFVVYGGFFLALAVLYCLANFLNYICGNSKKTQSNSA